MGIEEATQGFLAIFSNSILINVDAPKGGFP
jgi:hypothetical protein